MLIAEPSPTGIAARPDLCHKHPYVEARHGFENYASSMQIGTALSDLHRTALADAGSESRLIDPVQRASPLNPLSGAPAMSSNKRETPAPSTLRRQAALAFGSALRAVRLNRGISQMNLAASSALDPTYVSLMERGHRVPSFIVIVRLADALNVSPVQLFADGVARLSSAAPFEAEAVYRLACLLPNGQIIELEGVYSDFFAAMRNAQLQNIMRRKSGNPEITHVVEYLRTNVVDLATRTPR